MGLKIYGCLAAQNVDNAGESILIEGMDCSRLGPLVDEHHDEPTFFHILGNITAYKKLLTEKDCEHDLHKRTWDRVKVPCLYIEGELADDQDHPNAKAAAALIKFCARPDIELKPGLSVDGGIMSRTNSSGQPDEDGKILAKTVALRGSLTVKPANPKCFLSPMNDLAKSDLAMSPPASYWTALKKSQASSSFINDNSSELQLYYKLESMKKSLNDYFSGFTSIKCVGCGHGEKFFKSTRSLPNTCRSCGNHYAMSDIWKSLNK